MCGASELTAEEVRDAGFAALLTLVDDEPDLERCLTEPAPILRRIGARLAADSRLCGAG